MMQNKYVDINSESILIRIDGDTVLTETIISVFDAKLEFKVFRHNAVINGERKMSTSIIFENPTALIKNVLYNDPTLGERDYEWYKRKRYTLYREAMNRLLKKLRSDMEGFTYSIPRNGYHALYLKEKYGYKYVLEWDTGSLGLVMVDSHDLSEFGNVIDYVT